MYRKVAAALVVALALAAAGCGGGDEPLTRAQLTRRVEVACRQELAAAQARMRAGGDPNQIVDVMLEMGTAVERRLDGVTAPDRLSDEFDAFKQSLEDRNAVLQRIKDGGSRDLAAYDDEFTAIARRMGKSLRALGVSTCA